MDFRQKSMRNSRTDSLSAMGETESLLRGTGKDKPTRRRSQSRFDTEVNITEGLIERGERWRELAYVACPANGAWDSNRLLTVELILLGGIFWYFLVFFGILYYDTVIISYYLTPLKL